MTILQFPTACDIVRGGAEYGSAIESQHVTFLELAVQRFEARTGRPATIEEENWHFDNLQVS